MLSQTAHTEGPSQEAGGQCTDRVTVCAGEEGVVPTGAKCGLMAHTFRRGEVGTQIFSFSKTIYLH